MATPVEGIEDPGNVDPSGEVQTDPSITPDTNSPGLNPAWNDVLNLLPETFHNVVTPHFAKWDQAANERITSLNTQFEPYKPFIEHNIGYEDLAAGIRFMNLLNENPQMFYEQLGATLGVENKKTENTTETEPVIDPENPVTLPPGYEKLQQGVELMAQRMLAAEEAQRQQQANAELEADLKRIEQKHGKFDSAIFLPFLSDALGKGKTVDQAAQAYFDSMSTSVQNAQAQRPYAPKLLGGSSGSGAGLPSNNIDVTKLSDGERRALVVKMLEAAKQQG